MRRNIRGIAGRRGLSELLDQSAAVALELADQLSHIFRLLQDGALHVGASGLNISLIKNLLESAGE